MIFFYEYLKYGKKMFGTVEADTLYRAKEKLLAKNIAATYVGAKNSCNWTSSDLISFTKDMFNFLKATIPLYNAILIILEKSNRKKNFILLDICEKIKRGESLHTAFSCHKIFDETYLAMVAAGERSNNLEYTFGQLYKLLSKNQKIYNKIKNAMIYPAFILSFAFLITVLLFLFLIPSLSEILENVQTNWVTNFVLSISKFLCNNLAFVISFTSVFVCSIVLVCKKKISFLKSLLLLLPTYKNFLVKTSLTKFSRMLGVLLSNGVSLVDGLVISGKVVDQTFFEGLKDLPQKLRKGRSLSESLGGCKNIPLFFVKMVDMAEESGSLDEILIYTSEVYEEMVEQELDRFTNLLQPVILLVLGMVVGIVLLSVLIPMTDVTGLLN